MDGVTKKKFGPNFEDFVNPWSRLTKEEDEEMMLCLRKLRAWNTAWDCVEWTHKQYGIPYKGPSTFVFDKVLIRMEQLSMKMWNVL